MYINFSNYSRYSFSKIGATLTKDPIQTENTNSIELEPQILNSNGFLNDTSEWVKLSGSFIASGAEKYLSIGYFFSTVQDDTLHFQEPLIFNDLGYGNYYIDMVSLIELGVQADCEHLIPNVFTPNGDGNNDVWICYTSNKSELSILNRWGEVVYSSSGYSFSWNGEDLSIGVYYYRLKSENEIKTGFIHLRR
jgi:gliding motility-associated-like protein